MLSENHKGLKNGRDVEHEPSVVPKSFDIAFVTGVEEYRAISRVKRIVYLCTNLIIKPVSNHLVMLTIDEISLFECSVVVVVEVVQILVDVIGLPGRRVGDLAGLFRIYSFQAGDVRHRQKYHQHDRFDRNHSICVFRFILRKDEQFLAMNQTNRLLNLFLNLKFGKL